MTIARAPRVRTARSALRAPWGAGGREPAPEGRKPGPSPGLAYVRACRRSCCVHQPGDRIKTNGHCAKTRNRVRGSLGFAQASPSREVRNPSEGSEKDCPPPWCYRGVMVQALEREIPGAGRRRRAGQPRRLPVQFRATFELCLTSSGAEALAAARATRRGGDRHRPADAEDDGPRAARRRHGRSGPTRSASSSPRSPTSTC